MKILHTADWHLGERKGPVKDGVNLRRMDTINRIKEIIEIAKKEKPDIVMVSGDVIDKPDVYGKRALADEIDAERLLSELAACTGHLIVIRGTPNHDGAEGFIALKEHFGGVANVSIVTEPEVIHTDQIDIACLPGFDRGIFRAAFPDIPKEKEAEVFTNELSNIVLGLKAQCKEGYPSALMAHYYVQGTDTGNGGNFIQKFEPILSAETLNAAKFNLVALGHIHRPQKIETVDNCYYSGAVDRFTFNDEGFERGFYMHTIDESWSVTSDFIPVKARAFATVRLDNDDISAINAGLYDMAAAKWQGYIDDAIVRVRYSCTQSNHKALSHALLEKRLYEDGAFYVPEILPDDLIEEVDRKAIGKESDPETNLIEYLQRKEVAQEDIERLVKLARPIIAKAMTDVSASAMLGTFEPVSIEVTNYRNYAEASFDFSDITFCTINGENGTGKSSLFMDAIIDCLYEEPREGGNLGDASWVRGSEEAKSGTIIFTFRIGAQTFRVTRKRVKSGNLSLNLSELVSGEWINRSSEKAPETQRKILQILGMDSITFKSCALIMQDQYGIFLQASKDERMTILSNLLGLGIYDSMSQLADIKRKEARALKDNANKEIEIHEDNIKAYGNPYEELEGQEVYLEAERESLEKLMKDKEDKAVELNILSEAQENAIKLSEAIKKLEIKKAGSEAEKQKQLMIMTECDTLLNQEMEIKNNADAYRSLESREKQLIEANTLYIAKQHEISQNKAEQAKLESDLSIAKAEEEKEKARLSALADDSENDVIIEKAKEYDEKRNLYDELRNLQIKCERKKRELAGAESRLVSVVAQKDAVLKAVNQKKEELKKKTELLVSSGCVDVENANCRFLQDAKAAQEELIHIPEKLEAVDAEYSDTIKELEMTINDMKSQINSLGYSQDAMDIVSNELITLKLYRDRYDELQKKEIEISAIKASLEAKGVNISNLEERLDTVKLKGNTLASELEEYQKAYEESISILAQMDSLKPWLEKEQQIPVMKERKTNAVQRYTDLDIQIREIDTDIVDRKREYQIALEKTVGIEEKKAEVTALEQRIATKNDVILVMQTTIGALQQKIKDIEVKEKQVEALRNVVDQYSKDTADYECLKKTFSQDGIPHQIILSILPELTETANQILGQMTGGKMGVDFQTEKVNSQKKEKVALDVLITEYGKGTLPYLSRSGGEKVKSSLAVILALAEIKSKTAGMQLGMLFIDEPPFLDGDGIQAYCDALVTIQRRYPDLKIMAITHDPTMKARFPQSIDVVKTENGSKVIY